MFRVENLHEVGAGFGSNEANILQISVQLDVYPNQFFDYKGACPFILCIAYISTSIIAPCFARFFSTVMAF